MIQYYSANALIPLIARHTGYIFKECLLCFVMICFRDYGYWTSGQDYSNGQDNSHGKDYQEYYGW